MRHSMRVWMSATTAPGGLGCCPGSASLASSGPATPCTPDADGRYVVMGWNWCWEAVDPYACDRIVGDLPDPA
jgi:hypothetical protein